MVVGLAGVEDVQAAEAYYLPVHFGHQDRMAWPMGGEPGLALLDRPLLRLERGDPVHDPLVVDQGERGGIVEYSVPNSDCWVLSATHGVLTPRW